MSGLFADNFEDRRKEMGHRARSAFAVIVSLAVLLGGLGYGGYRLRGVYNNYLGPKDYEGGGDAKVVAVEVPQGASVSQIGSLLVDNGIVKSTSAFVSAVNASGNAAKLQPGTYDLHQHIPAATAVQEMLDPKNRANHQFTVPEGMWASDVLPIIAKRTGLKLADLQRVAKSKQLLELPSWDTATNTPDGFLFPDTYQIPASPTAQGVLVQMTTEFKQVSDDLDLVNKSKAMGYTPLQVLTVASILEAEVPLRYQAHVAGIIYNRLRKNMALQLDSTSHYAAKIPMNKLLPKDFTQIDTPFNTYYNRGLPPGPIDSPGKAAIQAALAPQQSDDLYWVAVNLNTGETAFAKDLSGQATNVARFNQWCKSNNYPSGCAKP